MKEKLTKQEDFIIPRERADCGVFPCAYYYPHWVSSRAEEVFGGKYSFGLQVSSGSFPSGKSKTVMGYKKDHGHLVASIKERFLKNQKFIQGLNAESKRVEEEYRQFLDALIETEQNEIEVLIKNHQKLIELYAEHSFWNCFVWFTASDDLYLVVTDTLRNSYNLTEDEIQILTRPIEMSYTLREELELLKLATNEEFELKTLNEQSPQFHKQLSLHRKRWGHIPWDYMGPHFWTETDLYERLQKLLSTSKQAEEIILHKENEQKTLKKNQETISESKKIVSDHQEQLSSIRTITMMQDDKKDIITYAQFVLHKVIFQRFSEILGIKAVDCARFSETELWEAVRKGNGKELQSTLSERKSAVTSLTSEKGIELVYGKEAEGIFHFFSSEASNNQPLMGRGVSRGKVHGIVRILQSGRDISKVCEGDILVAPMTTPDYVPAMRKAIAIITNEGGMTSHAAIVARELKIPCIVGTKFATEVLKDGDTVEVDADRGIVTIL